PDTVPYHAYEIRLNVIGGSSWRQAGEFISWEIDVPESGMYGLSFRAAQNMNRGVTSFRRLLVNGEVPFQQAEAFGFEFSTGYRQYDLTADGQYIYLEKGANRITLENAIGEFALPLQTVEESMAALNALYRRTSQLTGLVPDQYIDYEIAKKIPDFSSIMKEQSEILGSTVDALVAMTGEKSDKTALVATMAQQAGRLALEPEDVVKELDFFKGNISALGDWIIAVTEMPLYVDSFTLYAPGETYSPKESGFLRKLWNSIVRFLATFFVDETMIGDDDPKEALKVWIPTGRDQAQILKSMSQDSQIPVEIQLIPLDVVLPAVLAGNGPDVSLDMPQATILNFAMRNALVPLSDKADYEKVFSGFFQSSIDAVTYSGKVYGAPERSWFPMMYARDDILSEIGIEPPKTWDEFRKAIVELNINNYEAYVPTGYSSMGMSGSSSGFTVFISMLCQKGGNLYNGFGENYGISTGLYSEEAMNAFADFTKFYTAYKLPVYADFANRFRTGEMPLGIYDYTLYNTLEVFAPEIRGLWSFAPLPGYVREDGTIDNTVVAVGNYTAIMDSCKDKEAAWEFVKWWLSTETQTDYGLQMEAVLGGAGRYPTASKEVLASLPWSQSASKAILAQFENSVGIPEIPGGYMSYRMIDYAFRSVVTGTSAMSPRQALYLNLADIDKELDKKRAEFGLEVSGVPQ
ncbi:MAG: extracellular solute-binding protein, partial [Clostridiales bacterium]|nr:extracellular solute-binding protein [Clostridiales bacterium]